MGTNKIIIPDGCKAEIRTENGQTVVIVERREKENKEGRWRAKPSMAYWYAALRPDGTYKQGDTIESYYHSDDKRYKVGNYFHLEVQCRAFCDDLNEAIKPIYEKARQGYYDRIYF